MGRALRNNVDFEKFVDEKGFSLREAAGDWAISIRRHDFVRQGKGEHNYNSEVVDPMCENHMGPPDRDYLQVAKQVQTFRWAMRLYLASRNYLRGLYGEDDTE